MQHENTYREEVDQKESMHPLPGRAQVPTAPCVDDDVQAIRELLDQISHLWMHLTALSRDDLSSWLELLRTAADSHATDSRPVREALQQVLLGVGTGALAALSETSRQRLAALTGIALPGDTAPVELPYGTTSVPKLTPSASSPEPGGDG